ncbi:DUF5131 family protein [Sphingobium sp. YBL2]|uniref:DUF5131 family protein n=1 Tax=Sphingobium sp. (strain YBL2) TaxID=484429 RepID=UPI0005CC1334|nr:DUF5131 family protein [Sphingobium sp. YBL2]AJR24526.1 hypothetical protein TZ53_13130 [Sphingobium sp. YBL2]
MAEISGIEWTDATVNFWWGCTKVGPGCDGCYAETWSERFGGGLWGVGAERRQIKGAAKLLYKLHNGASWWAADALIGQLHPNSTRRVFIQSMSDLFDNEVPLGWFDEAWRHICACDRLEIQIVTKRVSIVEKRLAAICGAWPRHAGLIISVVNQDEADRDIPRLIDLKERLGIPWIGLSMEPLLGPVTLKPEWLAALDWVIVGGESGPRARPMHPDWARSLRDQCAAMLVPFLFKQWGEWLAWEPDDLPYFRSQAGKLIDRHALPDFNDADLRGWTDRLMYEGQDIAVHQRVGKKAAGRLLDEREHNGFPATKGPQS